MMARKTITVDYYAPRGTRGPMIADFWYRGELLAEILAAVPRDISEKLPTLRARGFTHWRNKQTGKTQRIE